MKCELGESVGGNAKCKQTRAAQKLFTELKVQKNMNSVHLSVHKIMFIPLQGLRTHHHTKPREEERRRAGNIRGRSR